MMNVYVLITCFQGRVNRLSTSACVCTSFATMRARSNSGLNLSTGWLHIVHTVLHGEHKDKRWKPCMPSRRRHGHKSNHIWFLHGLPATISCFPSSQTVGPKERGTNKQDRFWQLVHLPVCYKKTAFRSKQWRGERALNSQQPKRGWMGK